MEASTGQTKNPSSKNFEGHNNILDPRLGQPQNHPSFTETTTAPSTSASPSVESHTSAASDTAGDSTASSRDYKRKHDSKGYEIAEASPATDESNQQNETSKILDTSSTDTKKPKKTVKIKNAGSSAEGVAAEATPELLSIPQTNFAIGLLVMCCFNPPFGMLALYCSLKAAAAYRDGDKVRGAWFARTSIVISLLGIMITMVIITSVVLCIAVNKNNARKASRSSNALGF